jgi:threonine aldolase
MLGGGMRQTGWLATCGTLVLSAGNINRLKEDHDNALLLAQGLDEIHGVCVNIGKTQTNFVIARFEDPDFNAVRFADTLSARGILITLSKANTIRFVTSKEVSREDIIFTLQIIKEVLQQPA